MIVTDTEKAIRDPGRHYRCIGIFKDVDFSEGWASGIKYMFAKDPSRCLGVLPISCICSAIIFIHVPREQGEKDPKHRESEL